MLHHSEGKQVMRARLNAFAKVTTALCLSLAAFGAVGAAEAKEYRVVYIQGVTGNPFYTSVACGAGEVAKQLGVKFEAQGPQQFQSALQLRVLNAVVASKPDGIMFTTTDAVALTPTLLQAKEMGIKILSIDGDVEDMSIAVANIQSDNVKGGGEAAEYLAKALDGKGKVMAIMNSPASPVAQARLRGFTETIAKYPGMTFIGAQYTANQTAKAASTVTASVAAHPDLAGIFTLSTNNTEGASTGIREAQREGKIKLVGFDTSDPIVEGIRSGVISADIVQYPYGIGKIGMEMIVAALDGKPVARQVGTQFVVATPQNVDTPEVQKYIYKTHCD
jgi:ribose transport system substrate-binding protein